MAYVLTRWKTRPTSLPAKHGNNVIEWVCSWHWDKFLVMEIEASALGTYLKHMVIWLIINPLPLSPNKAEHQNKTPKAHKQTWKSFTVICLEKRYSFFSQIVSQPYVVALKCLVLSCIWPDILVLILVLYYMLHVGYIEELGFVWKYFSWYCFWCQ